MYENIVQLKSDLPFNHWYYVDSLLNYLFCGMDYFFYYQSFWIDHIDKKNKGEERTL